MLLKLLWKNDNTRHSVRTRNTRLKRLKDNMARDDITMEVRDDESDLGLDAEDLAMIAEAENDSEKVVTKSPPRPFQLGYISVFSIIVNKMIGKSSTQTSCQSST